MLAHIDNVTPSDLIRELSPEAVDYFTRTELGEGWGEADTFNVLRFVRLGALESGRIVLGSTIVYGPLTEKPLIKPKVRNILTHEDILRHTIESLAARDISEIRESVEGHSLYKFGLVTDAGRALVSIACDGTPKLHFSGFSLVFGGLNAEKREETVKTAELLLGENFARITAEGC